MVDAAEVSASIIAVSKVESVESVGLESAVLVGALVVEVEVEVEVVEVAVLVVPSEITLSLLGINIFFLFDLYFSLSEFINSSNFSRSFSNLSEPYVGANITLESKYGYL